MIGFLNILFDKTFLVTLFVGIFAFATIVTLGLPLMERGGLDDRLKSVARRREELRAKHHAALNAKRGIAAGRAHHLHEGDAGPVQAGQYAGIREQPARSWPRPAIAARRR